MDKLPNVYTLGPIIFFIWILPNSVGGETFLKNDIDISKTTKGNKSNMAEEFAQILPQTDLMMLNPVTIVLNLAAFETYVNYFCLLPLFFFRKDGFVFRLIK